VLSNWSSSDEPAQQRSLWLVRNRNDHPRNSWICQTVPCANTNKLYWATVWTVQQCSHHSSTTRHYLSGVRISEESAVRWWYMESLSAQHQTINIMSTKHHLLYMIPMSCGTNILSESIPQWCYSCAFNHYMLVWKLNDLRSKVRVQWKQQQCYKFTHWLIFGSGWQPVGWSTQAGMTRTVAPTPWKQFPVSRTSLQTPNTLQSSDISTPQVKCYNKNLSLKSISIKSISKSDIDY
jgi:hypothetical protein